MVKLLVHVLAVAAITVSFPSYAKAQTNSVNAIVTGRVVDEAGRPVSGARISVFPMGGHSGGLPGAVTDVDGKYRMVSPPLGRTRFCAVKETAGYPDVHGLLFVSGGEIRPEVNLVPGGQFQVDIQLGPPDGTLRGAVVDAASGAPVSTARLTLHRVSPESMYSTSLPDDGTFLFALPPAPIELTVVAPGYRPWAYSDPVTLTNNLVVSRSDQRTLKIELVPTK